MAKRLFLLDGMALVYRAHFALVNRPIFNSKGFNTSALYGFTQTLLEILNNQQPTHIAVAFDTEAPTERHRLFQDYKAQREAMPEDIIESLPHVRRIIQAFHIPVLISDGWEADDLIGTLVRRAERENFDCYMVTPDKDFSQLVSPKVSLYKPSRMGDGVEILGPDEIRRKWNINSPAQVVDILGLWGDASDNIPGVPGIGEKTASKLIAQYGTIENLLDHTGELKGKLKDNLETHREQALLSKKLATIRLDAPVAIPLEQLERQDPDLDELKRLCIEFEFNSIGKRLFGDEFKAGRGKAAAAAPVPTEPVTSATAATPVPASPARPLRRLAEQSHDYQVVRDQADRAALLSELKGCKRFSLACRWSGPEPKLAPLTGIAFSTAPHRSRFVPIDQEDPASSLAPLRPILEDTTIEKVGHDLKNHLLILKWAGVEVGGKLFDTLIAHSLIEPDQRHSLGLLSEVLLGYQLLGDTPPEPADPEDEAPATPGLSPVMELPGLGAVDSQPPEFICEQADLAWQLRSPLDALLDEKQQRHVFDDIEAPLIPVLVAMEHEGIRIDAATLADTGGQLARHMAEEERMIHQLAGHEFNVNSPKQLGEVLFDEMRLAEKPKKTRTGQYATNEQTLLTLAPNHEIVRRLLHYREAAKLKSTYVDALPLAILPRTGRVHTTFQQTATATGRLNSNNPNLQNIPIRTEQGQEIRRAFLPHSDKFMLLSADYSQIELRIIAALGQETSMIEAFQANLDIHTATAARVYGVSLQEVTFEMRRKAKMVNYGIAYGISAFGLSQRLGIARKEAAAIIDQYFARFPGIDRYMKQTIAFCQHHGFVQTVTGRRRYIRDIRSSNGTIRGAAERNAINAPIQGTAADMIKIAMVNIHDELGRRGLRTRLILQVHDELLFDMYHDEKEPVLALVEEKMKTAIALDVPIVVELGVGQTWLEAH